ncbi:MFS transporter [Kineococcus sp. SYSU DK018]|uniref:hypothetical protein n=1 Tax=Kineococcus sp. SYSU DK018 TaxID=3383139 RepID=UPI003D7C4203
MQRVAQSRLVLELTGSGTAVGPAVRAPGQLREGLAHVRRTPELAVPLLMTAIVGCLAFEFRIALPVVARKTFGGGPTTCGLLTAAPSLPLALAALTVTGAVSVALQSTGNTTPQLNSLPSVRGRVMALWSVAFLGSTPWADRSPGWSATGGAAATPSSRTGRAVTTS